MGDKRELWVFEGDLYRKDLGYAIPLRKDYSKTFLLIKTANQFKATIRAGKFTCLGGYPLYLFTSDSSALCFDCAKTKARCIIDSIKHDRRDGWKVEGCDVNYEDNELACDHCNKQIPSASESKHGNIRR